MPDKDFDYKTHEKLRKRTANKADSVLWTFKAYYKAADLYNSIDDFIGWLIIASSTILTIRVLWKKTPDMFLIGLAIFTAVISGYKKALSLRKKSEKFYRAGCDYQRLFEDFRDFIKLELSRKELGLDKMEEKFEKLSERRKQLNKYAPDLKSKWYRKLDNSIHEEVRTTEERKEKLTKEAKLIQEEKNG